MTRAAGYPVRMALLDLGRIPDHPLPPGYRIRGARAGDDHVWVALHQAADEYNTVTAETFHNEFGYDWPGFQDRGYFLDVESGQTIGTASAWYDEEFAGGGFGRVHWVAVVPEYQGKGLSKPLLARVLNRLSQDHSAAYLSTDSVRIPAISLYLKFGFRPVLGGPSDEPAWAEIRSRISHPLLEPPYPRVEDLRMVG